MPPPSSFTPPPSDPGLDPGQVWAVLRQNAKLIAVVALAFFVGTIAITLATRMQFRSVGRLYLGELESKQKGASREGTMDFSSSDDADLGSEIEVLRSDSLLGRTILAIGLNTSVVPRGWKPPRYLTWRLSKRNPALLDVGTRELAVLDARLDYDTAGEQEYVVKFTSNTSYELWQDDEKIGSGTLGAAQHFPGVSMTVTAVGAPVQRSGKSYDVHVFPLDETIFETSKHLIISYPKAITQGEPVRVVSVAFTHRSPYMSTEFLRRLMTLYLEERQGWKTEEASAAQAFVTSQLTSLRSNLDATEQKLAAYRAENRVVVLDSEAKAMIEQIGKYEEQRVAARLQVAALADMKRALANPNARMEAFLLGESDDTVLEQFANNLTTARQELSNLQERYSDAAPEVKEKRAEVDSQLGMVRNYVTNRLNRAQENLGSFNHIIGQFENKLKTVPGAELGLVQLARESEVYSKMYSYLLERQQQAAITKASTVSRNRILDMPKLSYREDSPSLTIRLAVSMMGLLVAAIAVLVRHLFSTKLQTELEVRIMAGTNPVLATLPQRAAMQKGKARAALLGGLEEVARDPTAPFTEALRMLRTHLYRKNSLNTGRVVVFTSPTPGDGKTTVAMSLAVMLAADNKNVLLVDADLRKPSHHKMLGQPQAPGLSTVLSGGCDWREAVHPIYSQSGEFYTLTAGEPGTIELLSSEELRSLLESARQRFDYVLLDSASFPMVSDALVLSQYADIVLSVVRLHHTPRRLAVEHLRGVTREAANTGVVVNGGSPGGSYGSLANYTRAPRSVSSSGAGGLDARGKARVIR